MKYQRYIFLILIIQALSACRKPCSEEPRGAEPLASYHVEWEITTDMWGDAVGVEWDSDSIFFFDENNIEIPFDWNGGPGTGNRHRSEPFFFYEYPEDEIAYNQKVTKRYFFEFHNFFGVEKDTLDIQFRAIEVECGQILDPLEFYFNGVELSSREQGNKRIIVISK